MDSWFHVAWALATSGDLMGVGIDCQTEWMQQSLWQVVVAVWFQVCSSSTSQCPSHSCRNVRILLESTRICRNGTGIRWNGTGIHRNPQEWDWIPQELLYSCRNRTGIRRNGIYWIKLLIYIYLLIFIKYLYFYICIYWSAFIYLNYCLVPFNIMNLQGLEMHGDMSWAS